jgi:hypothetical protein
MKTSRTACRATTIFIDSPERTATNEIPRLLKSTTWAKVPALWDAGRTSLGT